MEDESIRIYFGRIVEIIIGTKTCGREKSKYEVIWKILNILTSTYRKTTQMIEKVIPLTTNFTRETLLGRLQSTKMWMRQSG